MKRFLSIISVAFVAVAATAQSWKPRLEAVANNPEFASKPAVVLLDSTSVVVSPQGSGTFTIRKVIQVRDAAGALANRVIKYDYDPLTAFAEFADAKIYHPDGTVTELDVTKACDYPAPARAIYWGARQIMLEPGRLQPGDVIDYTIEKKGFTYALLAGAETDEDRFVPPMRGQFYDIVPFWVAEPTARKVYRVSLPKDKELQYEFYQGDVQPSVRRDGDRTVYTFAVDSKLPFEAEPNMVDRFDVAPKLMMSTTSEWKDKSLWFYNVNEDYGSFEPTPEAQKKVDEILRGKTGEMERISALTHWVADNMRYSGISMGKGEGYTLHNTQTNFTDRAGVCKDKAALLISMLRMAGFEAYPAMTMAGSRIESIPADHFNHCVAVVKLSDGTYQPLDPTWVPYNREIWSSAEQQQNYLPGLPEGSDLCITPVSAPENHYFRLNAKTRVSADGTLTGSIVISAEGQSDAAVRRPFLQGYSGREVRALEAELQRISPLARLTSWSAPGVTDYQKAPVSLTLNFVIPDYAVVTDSAIICKPVVLTDIYQGIKSFLRVNTDSEKRAYGFKDACSRLVELDETMTLPKGYKLGSDCVDEATDYDGDVASFSSDFSAKANTLRLKASLSLGKRVYDAGDWTDFRTAVNDYKELAAKPFVFVKD